QSGQHRGLGRIDPVRRLGEHYARRGADTLQLASIGNQVEIGFENLRLRPSAFDHKRSENLPELLYSGSPAGRATHGRIEQRRELHSDGAGTAATMAGDRAHNGAGQRSEIDAVMAPEAVVLGSDYRGNERRRNFVELRPRKAPAVSVDSQLVNRIAVAIQQLRVRGAPSRAHLVKRGRPWTIGLELDRREDR